MEKDRSDPNLAIAFFVSENLAAVVPDPAIETTNGALDGTSSGDDEAPFRSDNGAGPGGVATGFDDSLDGLLGSTEETIRARTITTTTPPLTPAATKRERREASRLVRTISLVDVLDVVSFA
ncbi:MAG: hypothetical protein IH991_04450 [Planctomycetes bacterium]|nr:hypothetical protein [Planctomycetota bacterium]